MTGWLMLAQGAQQPAPAELSWPEIAGGVLALLSIVALLMGAAGWWIRAMIRKEAAPAREAAEQTADAVRTSNGHTAGQLVEEAVELARGTQVGITGLRDELAVLTGWTEANRDGWRRAAEIAERAEAKADRAEAAIAAHLAAHDVGGRTG